MPKKIFTLSNNIAQALTTTVNSAKNNAGALRIEIIGLANIELDPQNPRELSITREDIINVIQSKDTLDDVKQREYDELLSLANSIKEHGLLNPVVVYKRGDKYFLIAGERRCLASIMAGCLDIKATVFNDKPSALKLGYLQWIENIERSDLRLSERINNLRKILTAYEEENGKQEITAAFFKNILGCSWTNAMNYHSVLNTTAKIDLAIKDNKVNNLEKAAFISKINSKEIQERALQACIAGESLKALKAIVSEEKANLDSIKSKVHVKQKVKKRGRVATKINLGTIKNTKVVKELAGIVLSSEKYSRYKTQFNIYNWEDYASASEAFQLLLRILENSHNKA